MNDAHHKYFSNVGESWIGLIIPYGIAAIWFFVFPEYNALGTTLAIMILFALSVEIVLGFGGINTLGQAVMFGAGAYFAGFASAYFGISDPILMLLAGALGGAAAALITGTFVLRGGELTVLAMTIVAAAIFYELSNTFSDLTGGFDGLQGITVAPIFGVFEFDLWSNTAFVMAMVVVFIAHIITLMIVTSPFGVMMRGIRSNPARMTAIGVPVHKRHILIYLLGGAIAGLAGGLQTVTTSFVTNEVFAFYISATVVVVMIIGGFGYVYGAFAGAAFYVIFQDYVSKIAPEYWFFWLGLFLVVIVTLAPKGLIGLMRSPVLSGRGAFSFPLLKRIEKGK